MSEDSDSGSQPAEDPSLSPEYQAAMQGETYKALVAQAEKNKAKITELAQMGASFDSASLTMLRLNVLMNFLFRDDPERMFEFELQFETAVAEQISSMDSEIRKAILTGALNQGPARPPGVPSLEQVRSMKSQGQGRPSGG